MSQLCTGAGRARVLFGLAGLVTIGSTVLAVAISPWFLILTLAVGVNELIFTASGECPASLVIRRVCRTGEVAR